MRYKLAGKEFNAKELIDDIEREATKQIFREIARGIKGKKNPRTYLKVLRNIATHGPIGLSELTRLLNIGTKQNVLKYLKWLTKIALIEKIEDEYFIPDPVIRRAVLKKGFIREVLSRLEK